MTFEHIDFYNARSGPDYTVNAVKINNVNDGMIQELRLQELRPQHLATRDRYRWRLRR